MSIHSILSNLSKSLLAGFGVALVAAISTVAQAQSTLSQVQSKGFVQCGVSQGIAGFSNSDDSGNWTGLDVDVCRAVAAAVFGDADKVKYTSLSSKARFTALQSGEIDILSNVTTVTMQRDTALGINFVGVNYYDGQSFMVRKDLGVTSALQLSGASVCTNTGTTTELNVADYFRANNMPYEVVAYEKIEEGIASYDAGRCDVYTTDRSGLYAERLTLEDKDAHVVLPETISKEPLGPAVRQGDDEWANIVRWSLNAMLNAEEADVTSSNVDRMLGSDNPVIRRMLGVEGSYGENLGLSNRWAYNIIKQVGNYSESFERNVGVNTPLGISRGLNALWTDGGIQYAPPIR
ncbi:MAG: amino acid ABC transporter substrate-binding protein [Parvularculales bacterium]